jgi:2',3'-cyclic-nucleotide 2'-phosphodiesterase (5'-nucleotidase family)
MTKTVNIYATNDIHSNFENYAAIASVLKSASRDNDLIVDSGDFHDFKSVLVSATDGLGSMKLLQNTGTDCMAIGNNEFFGPEGALQKMIASGLPMLSCNLFYGNGGQIADLKHSMIFKRNGVRLLVIGISPIFRDFVDENGKLHRNGVFAKMMNLSMSEPYEPIRNELKKNKDKYDMAIVLSHAGIKWDRLIAERVDGIDLICGGHSHTVMKEREIIHNTSIIQSGCYGDYYTKISCVFDDQNHFESLSSQLMIRPDKKDEDFETLLQIETERAEKKFGETLYSIDHSLSFDPLHECEAMDVLCDIMYKNYDCDFAMMHNGILNTGIQRDVSAMSLLQAAPSPLNPTVVPWSGRQILDAAKASLDPSFCKKDGMGPGFRGTVIGTLSFSYNVEVRRAPFTVLLDGKEIDPEQIYQTVSDDYMQRGTGYTMLKVNGDDCIYYPEYIRDVLFMHLKDRNALVKSGKRRIAG